MKKPKRPTWMVDRAWEWWIRANRRFPECGEELMEIICDAVQSGELIETLPSPKRKGRKALAASMANT